MKRLLFLFFLLPFVYTSQASHLKGGYITFTHVSGRTYNISLTIISDPTSLADPNTASALISFGDGISETVQRTSTVLANSYTRVNTYNTPHTYQAEGNYIISYTDYNLIGNLLNVNAGISENMPLYLETLLRVDMAIGITSSAIPHSFIPDPVAIEGKDFSYNASFIAEKDTNHVSIDPRGDRLEYELITIPNVNHTYPEGFTINSKSGMLNWTNVFITGIPSLYFIFYKVNIWRGNVKIGYIAVAQIIKTTDSFITFPTSLNFPSCVATSDGWNERTIVSNAPFQQEVTCMNNAYSVSSVGETDLSVTDQSSASEIKLLMDINTDSKMVSRDWPYFHNVRLTKGEFSKDYTLAISYNLSSGIEDITTNTSVKTYPNPASSECTFQLTTSGDYHLTVVDLTGRIVLDTKIVGNHYEWNTEDSKAGSYFYTIVDDNGHLSKGKLILTR